jgi:hypothetical protein
MSAIGALAGLQTPAAGDAAAASPASVWTHAYPPLDGSGTAATSGLNATATPHNPAPAATTLMLNRSKIVIDVEPFAYVQTFR